MNDPVFYLAHPLAADDKYTYQQNMDHVLKLARIIIDNGIRVIVPWHTLCLCLDDTNAEHRRIGLEIDCYVAERLPGIILSGHKLSTGMVKEYEANMGTGGQVINVVGVDDEALPAIIRRYAKLLERARESKYGG